MRIRNCIDCGVKLTVWNVSRQQPHRCTRCFHWFAVAVEAVLRGKADNAREEAKRLREAAEAG